MTFLDCDVTAAEVGSGFGHGEKASSPPLTPCLLLPPSQLDVLIQNSKLPDGGRRAMPLGKHTPWDLCKYFVERADRTTS